MTVRLALLSLFLAVAPLHATSPDCTPTRLQGLFWFQNSATAVGAWVPDGQVWLLKTAGIATHDSTPLEFMLQVEQHVLAQDNACCWLQPLTTPAGVKAATPKLALERPIILEAGERLAARTHMTLPDMALLYSGWTFEAGCLPRLLGIG